MVIAMFIALAVFAPALIAALHLANEPQHGTLVRRSRHDRYTHNGTRRLT